MAIADTLSRAFLPDTLEDYMYEDLDINFLGTMPISVNKLEQLKANTQSDCELQQLLQVVQTGWPGHKANLPGLCRPYWNIRDKISSYDGVLVKGERLIIPRNMRQEMLKIIHASHMGIEKCKRRAKDIVYWPGMLSQIEDIVSTCSVCNTYLRSNTKEPMIPQEVPSRPWAQVGADLFEIKGQHFLLLIDYYSGFIEVSTLTGTRSNQIITHCKSQFSRYGIPDLLITDNAPQFACDEFRLFTNEYSIQHRTSSPLYPQSNGMAEKAVQTVKNLLKKAIHDKQDPYIALLDYRNTPFSDTLGSPAQRLMGRHTKTLIPTMEKLLQPKTISPRSVQNELLKRKATQKFYYDRHTKTLPKINIGDSVLIQTKDTWHPAKVTKINHNTPRSYIVTTPAGKSYRRNRRHLRKTKRKAINTELHCSEDEMYVHPEFNTTSEDDQHESTLNDSPTAATPMLRRSQCIIRKPERYTDSQY